MESQGYGSALGKAADQAEGIANDMRERSAAQFAKEHASSPAAWDSLSTEARIERLRVVVNDLRRENQRLRKELDEVDKISRTHRHDSANGLVMTPVRQGYSGGVHCEATQPRDSDGLAGAWI